MGTWLNGYLVLQGNIPFGTAQSKYILKLLARTRLGTHWAKYPLSRVPSLVVHVHGERGHVRHEEGVEAQGEPDVV